MGFKIDDGTGSNRSAEVDEDHKVAVSAVSLPIVADLSFNKGMSYIFASGNFKTISTTGTETGILHIKNTSNIDLHIESIRTFGTNLQKWILYKNSTAGTLITDETTALSNNLNITSSNVADATAYIGDNGKTVSGGTMIENWINPIGNSIENYDGSLIIGTNDSIELSVEVDVSSEVGCRVIGYYK